MSLPRCPTQLEKRRRRKRRAHNRRHTETSTGREAGLPLYGGHIRRVPGVPQPKAAHPQRQEWYLIFTERADRDVGVLEISYYRGYSLGRAYKYTSDRVTHSLRLEAPTRTRYLRLGGFTCRPDGPATYNWSRFERNYVLRLTAAEEPCAVRRAILEGEWEFID
jgi:hypothetical protein